MDLDRFNLITLIITTVIGVGMCGIGVAFSGPLIKVDPKRGKTMRVSMIAGIVVIVIMSIVALCLRRYR